MKTPTKKQYAVIRCIERDSKKYDLGIPLFKGKSQTSAHRYISAYINRSVQNVEMPILPWTDRLPDDELPF